MQRFGGRKALRGAAVVAVFAMVLAACGSDNGGGGGTTTAGGSTSGGGTTSGGATSGGGTTSGGATSGGGASKNADNLWYMVTDQAGLGDKGFNDLAYAGVQQAATELGGTAKVIESTEQAQYVPNLEQAVASGATMTTGVGFLIADAMHQVASEHPDSKFVLIDAVSADNNGTPDDFTDDIPDANVQSVQFKENEGAYLAGIIAGMTSKTHHYGFVGGLEIPPVVRFLVGFQAALKTVDPQAKVDVTYVGSFSDPAKTKEVTTGYYDSGADIVFEVAGAGGLGAYAAAKEKGPGVWVMGTDTCKNQLAPDEYLTSATKDVQGSVFKAEQEVANGTFKGGVVTYGLAEDGVGVCDKTFGDLPQNIQDAVNSYSDQIKSGAITVPSTPDELASFTPPPPPSS
ncbi:MAG TPA: BMP family ABC transporter substrate-binding protein [Actinomycetota bacterium]|nr:BMP family ABC transporter substrate-binding protein [Actinomycetota bacterium]